MKWNSGYGEMMENFVTVYQVVEFLGLAYLKGATADYAGIGVKKRSLPS
jgi:hypothetical protein